MPARVAWTGARAGTRCVRGGHQEEPAMHRIESLGLRAAGVITLLAVQVFNGPAILAHAQAGICQQPASINIRQTPKLIYPIDLHFDQATSQYVGTNSDGKTAFPATAQVSIDSHGSFAMSISVQNGYTGSYSGTVTGGTVKGTYIPGPGFGLQNSFEGTVSGCISAPPTATSQPTQEPTPAAQPYHLQARLDCGNTVSIYPGNAAGVGPCNIVVSDYASNAAD